MVKNEWSRRSFVLPGLGGCYSLAKAHILALTRMGVDQMIDWLTKFHADGVYFHVAPLRKPLMRR